MHDELVALQEELRSLKQQYGSKLQLFKSKGVDAPFPITVQAEIAAPAEMSMYDISGLQVVIKVLKDTGLEVSIRAAELPEVVRQTIAHKLQAHHSSCKPEYLRLGKFLGYVQTHFKELVTSHPELIEWYESVDSNGASVRRYMLNHPNSHLEAVQQPLGSLSNTTAAAPTTNTRHVADTSDMSGTPASHPMVKENAELAAEVAYLERRFRSAFLVSSTSAPGQGEPLAFQLSITPTDPVWPKDSKLCLTGVIGRNFPAMESVQLEVKPSRPEDSEVCLIMDKILKAEMEAVMERLSGDARTSGRRRYILGELSRLLENNAGDYLHLAEDVAAKQGRPRGKAPETDREIASGVKFEGLDLETSEEDGGRSRDDSTSENELSTEGGSLTEDDAPVGGGAGDERKALEGSVLVLELQDLKLDNVDAMDPLMLSIQVMCSRCGSSWDCQLATKAVSVDSQGASGTCQKCSKQWSLEFQPLLAHAYSSVVAHLRPLDCRPVDLTPSLFACQCGSCSSVAAFKEVQVGQVKERNCSSCHLSMSVSYSAVSFVTKDQQKSRAREKTLIGSSVSQEDSKPKKFVESQLVPGTPLPAKGTCKHYPHSYRWLRFPCCGRRYPCDLCHEEDSDGHHMKWALRHVCGFCSTEQKIEDRCCNCNKPLAFNSKGAIGSQTRHWEGGQGCRDKRRLDRRDRAKYRNSKAKSVSKKSSRVGEEAAKQRKQAKSAQQT